MLEGRNEMASHTDPVCGMQVNDQQAAGQSNYQGQTYYFCSQGCKSKFDQQPEQYAEKAQRGSTGR
jgi:Cu+-exporting ATPase